MEDDKKVVDLKAFRFLRKKGRPKNPNKKNKLWSDLIIEASWIEYDIDGNMYGKSVSYAEDDIYRLLSEDGKKAFTEKCFYALGDIQNTDPSFAAELHERLEELYELGGGDNPKCK